MTSSTWTPNNTLLASGWEKEPGGWYQHADNIPWWKVALPGWWHRLTHRCSAHSAGVYGWDVMLRCICGAVRNGTTDPNEHLRVSSPGNRPLRVRLTEGWKERNSRYNGTALLYRPHVRLLVDELAQQ